MKSQPNVSDVALCIYAQPAKGAGIYGFVEKSAAIESAQDGDRSGDGNIHEPAVDAKASGVDYLQYVKALPRRQDGTVRDDLLRLVALNQMSELDAALKREPLLVPIMKPIIAGRLNFTDRRDVKTEG